jgi:hypothetical protein
VFGYYEPDLYYGYGYYPPYWAGRLYYPWWDWCDAPFVYFYYRYPSRFQYNAGFSYDPAVAAETGYASAYNDAYYDQYYYDVYDGGSKIEAEVYQRPLGVWVPGHWEERIVGSNEWAWVPGHYVY